MPWPKSKYRSGDWGRENTLIRNHERIITAVHTLLGRGKKLQGAKVLELGCGNGELLSKLAAKGASVTGVDYVEESVKKALARGVQVVLADAKTAHQHLPKEHFDAVITSLFLEPSVLTKARAMAIARSAEKLTRPGGIQIHLTLETNLVTPEEFSQMGLNVIANRQISRKGSTLCHMITLRKIAPQPAKSN